MERIHCCMKVTFYILWCFNIARKPSLPEDMKTVFFMWKLYFSNRNHCKKTWKPSTKIQFVGGKLIPQTVFLWNFVQYSLIFNLACFVLFHAFPQWHFLLSPHILYSLFVYLCQHRGSRSPAKLDTISERTKRRRCHWGKAWNKTKHAKLKMRLYCTKFHKNTVCGINFPPTNCIFVDGFHVFLQWLRFEKYSFHMKNTVFMSSGKDGFLAMLKHQRI